jgi:hypothetical protein
MDVPAVVVDTADVLHAVVRAGLLYHRVVHDEAAGLPVGLVALTVGYAQERLAYGIQESAPVHCAVVQHAVKAVLAARLAAEQTDQAAAAAAEHGLAAQAEQAEEKYQHGAGDTLLLLHAQAVDYLGDAENAVKLGNCAGDTHFVAQNVAQFGEIVYLCSHNNSWFLNVVCLFFYATKIQHFYELTVIYFVEYQ